MTRINRSLVAVLVAAGLIASMSVYGLAEGEELDGASPDPRADIAALDEIDAEEIQRHVEHALEVVPWDEIGQQLADVRGTLDRVDAEAIRANVEAAMAEMDVEDIHAEVRGALDDVDWDEIREDIEAAHAEIETIDLDDVRNDVRETLEGVDWDLIRQTLEEASGIAAEQLLALDEMLENLASGGAGVI